MSWVSSGLKKTERWIGSKIPHTSQADKRLARQSMKEQMDLYKQQKEELHNQSEKLAETKKVEADRLHQKQIRSLRRNLRKPGGLMNSQEDVKETLG